VYLVPRGSITFCSVYDLPIQDSFFDVEDIEIVFCHLLGGMNGHIITAQKESAFGFGQ
jgi:hypothetical protein